jgi:flagellar hook assembly protein FlgD
LGPAEQETHRSCHVPVTIRLFDLRLPGASPNPFRSSTVIRVETAGGPLGLEILDLGGRRVRRLAKGTLPAGAYQFAWDGRDDQGHAAGSGVYVARLSGPHGRRSTKLVLLR